MNKKIPDKYMEIMTKSALNLYDKGDMQKLGLAFTPKTPVYSQGSWTLFRYAPGSSFTDKSSDSRGLNKSGVPDHVKPILIIPSLINRPYIMDLLPANSLVEELVNAGLDVFLLDWGMPDESMGHLGFAHYAGSYITRAVRQIKKITGTDKIQLMGQCLGGTLAAMHAAHPDHLKNLESLILLTTPIDFQDSGLLAEWTSNPDFDIEKLTQAFMAIVPHKFFHASFPLLDVSKTLGKYKTLLEHFELPGFAKIWQALDYWANDNVDFTLQAFRDLIALLYQKNAFYKGEFFIKGRKICSKDLDLPILAVAAKEDHVFTEKAAEKILDSKAGKKKRVEYHVMPAGHVTLIAAHPVKDTTYKIFKDFLLKKHKL